MENQDSKELRRKDPVEQLQHKPSKAEFLIAGIGASAGGIQALQEFFRHVPPDSGIGYVVILHLSPDHDSLLAEILQREIKIPVAQVTEKTQIEPNHVYVVPPNQHLTMNDGSIIVSPNINIEDRRAPVDLFFRTLADEHGPRAVAVILSGTGANGSMGIKRIKERGGACFVQNPQEAEFGEMPRNSIATGLVDEVLNVADIPAKIIAYKKSLGSVQITDEAEKRPDEEQQALREIFTQVRVRTGHDFSNYKRPTLLRRIERRINVKGAETLPAYSKYVREDAHEAVALMKDLLISVTNFFRDKKAFDIIDAEILPVLIKAKNENSQLRIWVAGCATGEEAYSIAMLCAEHLTGIIEAPMVQIFATDIDDASISQAREGLYSLNDAADVSPERLRRFFNKEGDRYRIRREVREMVMFATHNFLKDPPFSHLDLITCRNVMIYLNAVAQERVIETFHFALNPGSYLFLGNAESVDGATDLYAVYNREYHIFQSRQVSQRSFPIPESLPSLRFDNSELPQNSKEREEQVLQRISFADLHQQLLEQYAAPSLVINEEFEIVHLTEKAGKYLQIGGGEISQNLLKLIKPELRLEIRSALYQALERQTAVEVRSLKVLAADKTETINIHIKPVLRTGDTAKGFILVVFEPAADDGRKELLITSHEPVAQHLEEELIRLKIQLRSSNEQHEFQSEELKATNEELQAMNEELRSAAEELETSKEELQSINEELRTVNQELKVKIEEANISTNNLQNLVNSTDIGTIFLDRSFCVVLFTPATRNIFNLIPTDYGRPLSDITSNLEYPDLLHDAETVLDKLKPVEQEVNTKNNRFYLMRITPYRTDEDRIKGVVITFLDITFRRQAEAALQKNEQRLQRMVNVPQVGVLTFNYTGTLIHANDAFLDMLYYSREEFNARQFSWRDFTPTEHIDASMTVLKQLRETGRGGPYEKEYFAKDGSRIWMMFVAADLGDDTIVEYAVDISESKKIEKALGTSEEKFRTLFESIDEGFCIIKVMYDENNKPVDHCILEANPAFEKHTGIKNPLKKLASELMPGVEQYWNDRYAEVIATGKSIFFEPHSGAFKRWFDVHVSRIGDESQHQVAVIFRNITERKKSEEALRTSESRLRALVKNLPGGAVFIVDKDLRYLLAEGEALINAGSKPEDYLGKPVDEVLSDEILDVHQENYRKALAGNTFELEHQVNDRTYISRGVPLTNMNGEVYAVLAISYDITDRKKAEEGLRLSEERLRIALESANMGAWDWNITDDRVIWNDQHYFVLGIQPHNQEKNANFFLQFIHDEDKERVIESLMKAVEAAGTYQADFRIVRADTGEVRWMVGYGSTIAKQNGKAARMVGVMFDITNRKKLEQQKEDFIGIASHELKTPVTSIKAYAEVLHEIFEESGDTTGAGLLQKLDNQVDRLIDLIRALLDTSKLAEGELPLHTERFEICGLIKERIQDLQRLSSSHPIQFITSNEIFVTADRERIGQVLNNFVSNAIKYSPNGSDVIIKCETINGKAQVSVTDSGIGISEEMQQKVFDRFFRVKSEQMKNFAGMGLGLYITAYIVQKHGGRIWVESNPGEGSTFYFTLPVEK